MEENINRLELFWVDKYKEIKLEPRILIEDKEKATEANCTYLDMLNVIRHTDKAVRWCLL